MSASPAEPRLRNHSRWTSFAVSRLNWAAIRPVLVWALVPLAILMLAWSGVPLTPARGLDPSWQGALQMAQHSGLSFGDQIVFTYGPLGFLYVTYSFHGHLAELAFFYALLVHFGVAFALFAGARRSFGTVISALLALLVASTSIYETELVAFFILAVGAIGGRLDRRQALTVALAAGAFAGLEMLIKLSVGVSLVALATILVVGLPGRRRDNLGAGAAAFLAALLLGWLVAGQDLGALPSYLRYGAEVTLGYGPAMSVEDPGLAWQYTAALVVFGLGVWGALRMTDLGPARERWGIVLLWTAFAFFLFKEAFVRHDAGHATIYFCGMLAGFLAFRWAQAQRPFAVAGIAAMLAVTLAAQGIALTDDVDPVGKVNTLFTELGKILPASGRNTLILNGQDRIKAADPVDPLSLSLLKGHTVDIYPTEIAIAWAYHLNWDPLPVLQSYVSYRPALDKLDADAVASSRAPERILLTGQGIDGRWLSFDEGATSRSILCHYGVMRATPTLEVLNRQANRCTTTTQLAVVHADWGETVSVPAPAPGSLVYVRIDGVDVGGLEKLRSFFFKPNQREVVLGGFPHRLIEGTAADGLPLRAAPGVDFPPPESFAPNTTTIAVLKDGQSPTGEHPITYSFYSQAFVGPPTLPTLP